jgi:hypothetical protein
MNDLARPPTLVCMARSGKADDSLVEHGESDAAPNPVWFKPIMVGLMLVGLAWVLVFYLSGSQFPIPGIGAWNLVIGFGIAFAGFLMTTRWR